MVDEKEIWKWLEGVSDPEIPVLTIVDLGIVRMVEVKPEHILIQITPTYSGCPAMQTIEEDILILLKEKGIDNAIVELVLAPAWTTDWISENGKQKLFEYGIAPPVDEIDKSVLFADPPIIKCPNCHGTSTRLVSQFGSTACKAHYQCKECLEPFDYFKCLK